MKENRMQVNFKGWIVEKIDRIYFILYWAAYWIWLLYRLFQFQYPAHINNFHTYKLYRSYNTESQSSAFIHTRGGRNNKRFDCSNKLTHISSSYWLGPTNYPLVAIESYICYMLPSLLELPTFSASSAKLPTIPHK